LEEAEKPSLTRRSFPLRFKKHPKNNSKELLRGPTFYVLALIATTLLAWRSSPVSALVVALMCGGDGLADIAGRRWGGSAPGGRGRLPWNPAKSWAGSAAMFGGGAAMAAGIIALFVRCGYFSVDPGPAAAAIAATAGLATLAESLPLNAWIDDNISVPALAALAGWWLLRPVG
jgi:phytol kinase